MIPDCMTSGLLRQMIPMKLEALVLGSESYSIQTVAERERSTQLNEMNYFIRKKISFMYFWAD